MSYSKRMTKLKRRNFNKIAVALNLLTRTTNTAFELHCVALRDWN